MLASRKGFAIISLRSSAFFSNHRGMINESLFDLFYSMAKKNTESESKLWGNLKEETKHGVYAIVLFVLALFFLLSAFEKAGFVGNAVYGGLTYLIGIGYFLVPLLLVTLGISFLKMAENNFVFSKIFASLLFFTGGLAIIQILAERGGIIGDIISLPLLKLFDTTASLIILFAVIVISSLILFDTHLHFNWLLSLFHRSNKKKRIEEIKEVKITGTGEGEEDEKETPLKTKEEVKKVDVSERQMKLKIAPQTKENQADEFAIGSRTFNGKEYTPPPISLLEKDSGKPVVGDIKANANIIKRTLQNFGINVEMDEISIGPSVTRYSLKPAEGIKLSKIVALQNDLALALAAHPLRIEAPIPGKSLVGIEIPNSSKTTVGLGTLFSNSDFQQSEKPLLVSLGKSVSGKSHYANLAKMPHLLIAGTTGSGKSVTIHAIIASLLYRSSPDNLKFIMIDPKRVELTLYNKIPHLLSPVITDAKKAILALKWAAKEMDRRYDILESQSVRDIDSYHKTILAPALKVIKDSGMSAEEAAGQTPELMPYIVIIIDELADIMTTYPRELEAGIVRLAQMSRAVGIHLILSTQRPSVNVITGLIKANIPSRIALQVSSQIDSRTILDTSGAEKLLGAGDMLYLSGEMSKPLRIQCPYITEKETKSITKYLADAYQNEIPNEINLATAEQEKNVMFEQSLESGGDTGDDDDLYEEAKDIVLKAGKASTSYIQRKLRVGYARAARLVDMLEERGVIGAADGSKAREVINGEGSPIITAGETEAVFEEENNMNSLNSL